MSKLEFSLGAGGDLSGVVLDSQKRPLADVGLSVSADGNFQQIEYTTTDETGRYRLEHLPRDAALQIRVSKLDYLTQQVPVHLTVARQARDIVLQPRPHGGSIAGVVRDETGQPVAGRSAQEYGDIVH